MADKKEKKYVSDNACLIAEWNWKKNNDLGLNPKEITCGSGKKVWWICPEGHSYQATVHHRSYVDNCPYCSGQRVLAGYNDLESTSPQLALEWNYEKNAPLLPNEVTSKSKAKVWWKCNSCNNEWEAEIKARVRGTGCPIYSKRKQK